MIHLTRKGSVVTLSLSRPEALNALNKEMLEELLKTLKELREESDLRCLILEGDGEKAFVAGADIGEMAEMDAGEAERFARFGSELFSFLAAFPAPVIAAVNGFALGGGFELALACDIRLASESARFAFPETGLGITPGFGGTQRLARLAGPAVAAELIFSGRRLKADEALSLGLVNAVYPVDQLKEKAMELAQTIAAKAPVAQRQAKIAIHCGLDEKLDKGLKLEAELFAACFETEDQKAAMRAFLRKEAFNDFRNR